MLPLRRPADLRRSKTKAMAGPAMSSWMPKQWKPILKPMVRNNSTSRRARSASTRTVLSANTVKSEGGPQAPIT